MTGASVWGLLECVVWFGVLCGAVLTADPVAAQDKPAEVSVTGNPAATTILPGTGQLGRTLGLRDDWGVRLGGVWLADANLVAAGGPQPGGFTANSALIVGLNIDAEKAINWRGASFGFQFLQFDGGNTNAQAGTIAGYNAITGPLPLDRSELFQAWYEQAVVTDVLKVRIGRSTPSADFNNVTRPVAFDDATQNIPAVSGLLYTTIFCNGSMLGVLPGYYNPGNGVTVNFTPSKSFYLNVGAYDGNLARGIQTGLSPPLFNGYYFTIAEIGFDWLLGEDRNPGAFAIGLWRQTGQLTAPGGIVEDGTGGVYLFGSQRLAFGVNGRVPTSSISAFYQFGVNDSRTLPINQYYGAGLTAFGLIGDRARDSMGIGIALSRTNPNLFVRPTELILQAYYQAHLFAAVFLQPTISYIPAPAATANAPDALTTTLQLTVLF